MDLNDTSWIFRELEHFKSGFIFHFYLKVRYKICDLNYFFFKNFLYNMHIVFHGVTNMPY